MLSNEQGIIDRDGWQVNNFLDSFLKRENDVKIGSSPLVQLLSILLFTDLHCNIH